MFYVRNYLPLSIKSKNNWCQLKSPSLSPLLPTSAIARRERAIRMDNYRGRGELARAFLIRFYLTTSKIIIRTGCNLSTIAYIIAADLLLNYRRAGSSCNHACRDARFLRRSRGTARTCRNKIIKTALERQIKAE